MAIASAGWRGSFRSRLGYLSVAPFDALSLTTCRAVLISPTCRLDACPVELAGPVGGSIVGLSLFKHN